MRNDDSVTLPIPVRSRTGSAAASPERLLALASSMCGLLRAASEYSWLDRRVYDRTVDLHRMLADLAADEDLRLDIESHALRMGDERIDDPPVGVQHLLKMYRRKGIRAVCFTRDVSLKETMILHQLLQTRAGDLSSSDRQQLPNIQLEFCEAEGLGVPHVPKGSPLATLLTDGDEQGSEVRNMVAQITAAIDGLSTKRSAQPPDARASSGSTLLGLVSELGAAAEVTLILASLRRHDEYTYDHSVNVGLLSIAMAQAYGWSGRDLHEFGVAALIHDVGKIYTPLEILNKPGRLTPQEWVIMKKHPRDGYDILRESGVANEIAPLIALEHHISYDGTGYPRIPKDRPVHLGSQMVKIADVYDAFTTIRPYRSQARPAEVLKMLHKQAGTHFHPDLVEAFCSMMGDWAIGSAVKLRSGNIALVVQPNLQHPSRPVVRVLQDERGRKPRQLELIDLAEKDAESGEFCDEIVEAIDPVIRNIPVGRYL